MRFLLPFLCLFWTKGAGAPDPDLPFMEYLDQNKLVCLKWGFDNLQGNITFKLVVNTTGWVGFGLSPNEDMVGSDIVMGGLGPSGSYFADYYATRNAMPLVDEKQSYNLLSLTESAGQTIMTFQRSIQACDDKDFHITAAPIKLIYAYGENDDISYHGARRGTKEVNLLKYQPRTISNNLKYFNATLDNIVVPPMQTYYHCKVMKFPTMSAKHHIYMVEPVIERTDIVHHILLHRCPSFVTAPYDKPCYMGDEGDACFGVVAAWAVGGGVFELPENLGIPIGGGDSHTYYKLEIHYNNPNSESGRTDSSGVRLYYTDQLRQYDVGILTTGLLPSNHLTYNIPPKATLFHTYGMCNTTVFSQFMNPVPDLQVFAVLLHTHLVGRKVRIGHYRNGEQIGFLGMDENYNFEMQQIINLGNIKTIKHMGLATTDEMCLAFLFYYPEIKISTCVSHPITSLLNSSHLISTSNQDEIAKYESLLKTIPQFQMISDIDIISRKNPEDVQEITVWKRYSDFRKLHQNLWQLHKNVCSQSELFPPFARAKVFVVNTSKISSREVRSTTAQSSLDQLSPSLTSWQDSLSDCSSDVQRDISGADDLTITSEYGGPSSDSDLTSLAVDTDSLAGLDDGMASGRTSPNQPQGGATNISSSCSPRLPSLHERCTPSPAPVPASSAPNPEVSWPGRTPLFSVSLKKVTGGNPKDVKSDYLDKASELICVAVQKEKEQDFQAAFSCYRSGVDLLLQGVQGEPSPTRREAVKKKTAEYLMRAEQISSQHLRSNMGQGSPQTVALGAQCCPSTSRGGQQSPSEELRAYRVLGVIDKVLLVMDKRTQEMYILKGLRRSSDCGRPKRTIIPHSLPHMVQLRKFIVSEDAVFLLLQYAEGGKLWSHIGKYLRNSSPDESFDIPFIQKSHTTAVHTPQHPVPQLDVSSASSGSGPVACSDSVLGLQSAGENVVTSPQKNMLIPRLIGQIGAQSDSGANSDEECTNSYLTLCNEYEQDKVEPDALEEEEDRSEQEMLSLEVPIATTTTSSRSRSLLSNDSLSSPISSQELGFFTESSDKSGHTLDNEQYRGEGQDHSEVFSPLPSPAVPLSLDQSKHTPMEFFRIDSKDSASEVTCLDIGEQRPSHKQVPFFSTSDLGSDVAEDLPELAQEVKGHSSELWALDCSDKGSNESVPVISFKEAVVEDEGHPPDLLVNLPVVSGTVDTLQEQLETSGVCLGLEVTASPQKFIQPDVLQLPTQPEEGEEQTLEQELSPLCSASATCDTSVASSSPFNSLWDCSLAYGQEASDKMVVHPACQNDDLPLDLPVTDSLNEKLEASAGVNTDLVPDPSGSSAGSILVTNGTKACAAVESLLGLDGESSRVISSTGGSEFDKEVSRLFAELDELSLAASQARIPEEFVRCWAVEMVTALDSLHQEGIICRDLNPNNILLDHQGHVQFTYFCSWSDVEESCDKEAIANMYCAPEVGGISEDTAACDWWSLGAILFELLTGTSLLRCHPAGIGRHTTLNVPESVSEEARSLLEQLLQYNPMERLGAGVGGVDDIKSHPFFARVEWAKRAPGGRVFAHRTQPGSAQNGDVGPPSSRLTTCRKVHGRCNVVWVAVVAGGIDDPIPGP
ncbi:hypothetical protein L3Q82_001359 [Scortum barcoo]|uniref:Uncharacterized protein n=1 Tax=Scortum barcoo TaxID=214431 RepID=A0ACB8W7U8_9TELE|nr:hypothetical protein L3Q82_001359 [Scortum barcoo]